nr:conotoxin precursor C [Conus judaeus]DAZ85968.1 TPA_inf: conotoxin precursor C [Conus ebraeus]
MQTAYWVVMMMMMVWITAPLSEGGKLNDVIRGLVPDDLTLQRMFKSLFSHRLSGGTYSRVDTCIWKVCPQSP